MIPKNGSSCDWNRTQQFAVHSANKKLMNNLRVIIFHMLKLANFTFSTFLYMKRWWSFFTNNNYQLLTPLIQLLRNHWMIPNLKFLEHIWKLNIRIGSLHPTTLSQKFLTCIDNGLDWYLWTVPYCFRSLQSQPYQSLIWLAVT